MRKLRHIWFVGVIAGAGLCSSAFSAESSIPTRFTRLVPLPAPRLVSSADAYPGAYEASRLLDGDGRTEYASNGKGTNTFVEVEFAEPTRLAAFRHVERNDPATVASSELIFTDDAGNTVSRASIKHVNERGGTTFFAFPGPVVARKVRWQVTELGAGLATVGGAEITFF